MDLPWRMLPLVSVGVAELHPGGMTALGCAVEGGRLGMGFCGGCDVDMVEGLISTSPGTDLHGSHTLSLLQIRKACGRSWGPRGVLPLTEPLASGRRDEAVFATRCFA